jgi:hypothetical protein
MAALLKRTPATGRAAARPRPLPVAIDEARMVAAICAAFA